MAQRRARTVYLMLTGLAADLHRSFGEAEHPRCADGVRGEYASGGVGRRDGGLKALQGLEGHGESTLSATNMAQIYAGLGENDLAFEWLEKAYQQRAGAFRYIRCSLFFYDLRSDPRFRDILARMKLPQLAAGAPR